MIKHFQTQTNNKPMSVQLFVPCFVDQIYPKTAKNTVELLNHLNIEVMYNSKQTCCGQIHYNSGYWVESSALAHKFLNDFNTDTPIVCPSASCIGYIRNNFEELKLSKKDSMKSKILCKNLYEITDFIVNELNINAIDGVFKHKITYHDSCSALREYGLKQEPRQLLKNIEGLELIEMNESDTCCGFGGTFSVKNEAISTAMAEQKTEFALATGAEYLVSSELSCIMHLQSFIKQNKLNIETISVVDLLATAISNNKKGHQN